MGNKPLKGKKTPTSPRSTEQSPRSPGRSEPAQNSSSVQAANSNSSSAEHSKPVEQPVKHEEHPVKHEEHPVKHEHPKHEEHVEHVEEAHHDEPEAKDRIKPLIESTTYNGRGSLEHPRYNDFAGQLVRVVFLGETGCGKTSLIERYTKKRFIDDVKAPVHEQFTKSINQPDGEAPLELTIVDTANTQIHAKVRTLAYADADVFVVCINLSDPHGLDNIRTKWLPELITAGNLLSKNLPVLLVGCKSDERHHGNECSKQHIEKFAHQVKAFKYLECSAKNDQGCIEVIHQAISACTELGFEDK